jgi:hypothetical protein
MIKFVPLAVIAIAAVTITNQAHAQAAIQEPGMAAFYQSLGVGRSGYRAPAESYATIGAISGTTSRPARKSEHGGKQISGTR